MATDDLLPDRRDPILASAPEAPVGTVATDVPPHDVPEVAVDMSLQPQDPDDSTGLEEHGTEGHAAGEDGTGEGRTDLTRRADLTGDEDDLGPTQALDVAELIALERRATRRALSAEDIDPTPEPPTPESESRRARREAGRSALDLAAAVDPAQPRTAALAWVDPAAVQASPAPASFSAAPHVPATAGLLPPARTRRTSVAAPLLTAGGLALAYVVGCALWPLGAVAPTVSEAAVQPAAGRPLGLTWPAEGTAAVGAEGLGTIAALNTESVPMASIAKVVTVLMILDKAPLAVGETGPSYPFTVEDNQLYWQYRYQNESALDVPIDGELTQRQMLEGILIGSANNYIDRLTTDLWGSKDAFVLGVPEWLAAHGLSDITMVDASGIDPDNTATPAALVKLASLALAHPVVAEIVAMPETELPGAGVVKNSNPLIGDAGVVGIKTGTLSEWWIESWNLLTAKDITLGQTTVRVYAAVLGQPDADMRASVSRQLLDEVEQSLQPTPTVAEGTTVASITTEWGEPAEVVTGEDAQVVLWDGGIPSVESEYDVEVGQTSGTEVGELTATGPFDSASVPLVLKGGMEGPSLGWRLTHPLDLLGLQ
ncbi:D-alanyl-D-alanine carboxypeptidase [Microbacterium sp. NPDC096154]|uniref:D-alanyl-D-alanine carboxypeptidase family protein n=1 Tax=Microbacterium sp. NPDC096154 TaxID=3155549 RepID=UPI00331D50D6